MSDGTVQNKESLSAIMDGEGSEFELRKILRTLNQGSELREQWQRYHLVSASLRKESLSKPDMTLCDRIHQAVQQEQGHGSSIVKRLALPLSRFAVAASVATLAVIGVQQYNFSGSPTDPGLVAGNNPADQSEAAEPVQLPSAFSVPSVPVRAVSASNSYMDFSDPKPVVLLRKVDSAEQVNHQQVEAYLNNLMRKHTENSALNANQGVLPLARMPAGKVERP